MSNLSNNQLTNKYLGFETIELKERVTPSGNRIYTVTTPEGFTWTFKSKTRKYVAALIYRELGSVTQRQGEDRELVRVQLTLENYQELGTADHGVAYKFGRMDLIGKSSSRHTAGHEDDYYLAILQVQPVAEPSEAVEAFDELVDSVKEDEKTTNDLTDDNLAVYVAEADLVVAAARGQLKMNVAAISAAENNYIFFHPAGTERVAIFAKQVGDDFSFDKDVIFTGGWLPEGMKHESRPRGTVNDLGRALVMAASVKRYRDHMPSSRKIDSDAYVVIKVNLAMAIVSTMTGACNETVAIYHRELGLLVVDAKGYPPARREALKLNIAHAVIDGYDGKVRVNKIVEGDGFGVDTWDEVVKDHLKQNS